jgi:hypothetical protein
VGELLQVVFEVPVELGLAFFTHCDVLQLVQVVVEVLAFYEVVVL